MFLTFIRRLGISHLDIYISFLRIQTFSDVRTFKVSCVELMEHQMLSMQLVQELKSITFKSLNFRGCIFNVDPRGGVLLLRYPYAIFKDAKHF